MVSVLSICSPSIGEAATEDRPSVAPADMQAIAPALAGYTDDVLFGDNWENPRLSSLITVSALIAGGKSAQLSGHLGRALDNGVTPSEISGLVTHLAFYSGWSNAVLATTVVREMFDQRKLTAVAPAPAPAAYGHGRIACLLPQAQCPGCACGHDGSRLHQPAHGRWQHLSMAI